MKTIKIIINDKNIKTKKYGRFAMRTESAHVSDDELRQAIELLQFDLNRRPNHVNNSEI